MAQLLIYARDSKNPNDSGQYQKGDIVEVRDDHAQFGACECLPRFLVVQVDGTKEENRHLMEAEIVELSKPETDRLALHDIKTRRKHTFDFTSHLGTEKLAKIKSSEWLIERIDKAKIVDKTKRTGRPGQASPPHQGQDTVKPAPTMS